jgi:hypothetical protein
LLGVAPSQEEIREASVDSERHAATPPRDVGRAALGRMLDAVQELRERRLVTSDGEERFHAVQTSGRVPVLPRRDGVDVGLGGLERGLEVAKPQGPARAASERELLFCLPPGKVELRDEVVRVVESSEGPAEVVEPVERLHVLFGRTGRRLVRGPYHVAQDVLQGGIVPRELQDLVDTALRFLELARLGAQLGQRHARADAVPADRLLGARGAHRRLVRREGSRAVARPAALQTQS